MIIYISAPPRDHLRAKSFAYECLIEGHTVSSSWLKNPNPLQEALLGSEASRQLVKMSLDDICKSDVFVLLLPDAAFTQDQDPGCWFELGFAITVCPLCCVIGNSTCLFSFHPNINKFIDGEDFFSFIYDEKNIVAANPARIPK